MATKRDRAPYMKSKRAAMKLAALQAYSPGGVPQCACPGCPEKTGNTAFLTIDHIDGGGAKHRKELGSKPASCGLLSGVSMALYYWLRDNNYPPGFQVLCFNCNSAKHHLGACPHAISTQENQ